MCLIRGQVLSKEALSGLPPILHSLLVFQKHLANNETCEYMFTSKDNCIALVILVLPWKEIDYDIAKCNEKTSNTKL